MYVTALLILLIVMTVLKWYSLSVERLNHARVMFCVRFEMYSNIPVEVAYVRYAANVQILSIVHVGHVLHMVVSYGLSLVIKTPVI